MTQSTKHFGMGGGLDLVTPPIIRGGGKVIAGYNYEPRTEGYRRISGFERWDGTGLPSKEVYHVMYFTGGTAEISASETVTGSTSGATCTALFDASITSGTYAEGDAEGFIVVALLVGTFQDAETLQVGGFNRAVMVGEAVYQGATSDVNHRAWEYAAIEMKRNTVLKVPGSGPVRGVWSFGGNTYAFRDNAGSTACVMHRSSVNGWQPVDLGQQISFDGGVAEIAEGDTVTGQTSNATATVSRVLVHEGVWDESDAQGRLILSGVTGTFEDNENLRVGGEIKAVAASENSAIALLPGGRFEFVNENFYGGTDTRAMYGCDGVNRAFEYDGVTFVPIHTGMEDDTPIHIAAHNSYLVLAFRGGSVQFSALGEPISWQVSLGAAEIGMGDDVTGLVSGYASALMIFCRNRTGALYGKVVAGEASDSNLEIINNEVGAFEWSVQALEKPIFYDNAGIRDVMSTQAFGNFKPSILSEKIGPYLSKKLETNVNVAASFIVRSQSQYWLIFDDLTGLIVSMASGKPEIMPMRYDRAVTCTCSVENSEGNEVIYFGSDDGFVYRVNSGNSFDEAIMRFKLRLPFNNLGSPTQNKRFIKATLELATDASAKIGITADFSYGDPKLPSVNRSEFNVFGGGGFWDEVYWDNFYWSQVEGTAEADIPGKGTNVSVSIGGETQTDRPHTVHGIIYHYSPRGLKR